LAAFSRRNRNGHRALRRRTPATVVLMSVRRGRSAGMRLFVMRLLIRAFQRLLILGLGVVSVWLIVDVFHFVDRRAP